MPWFKYDRRILLKRAALCGVSALVSALLTGCLIFPLGYYTEPSRKNVSERPPDKIVPGVTSREEVLLLLGEPDKASADEREFWYIAEKAVWGWMLLAPGPGGGGGDIFYSAYVLTLSFNGDGIVELNQVVPVDTGSRLNPKPIPYRIYPVEPGRACGPSRIESQLETGCSESF